MTEREEGRSEEPDPIPTDDETQEEPDNDMLAPRGLVSDLGEEHERNEEDGDALSDGTG
jgi:hypothetical protein